MPCSSPPGVGAMYIARNYRFGTTLRMGPGYFPIVLSGIICSASSSCPRGCARTRDARQLVIRALIILPFSIVVFGVMMNLFGFIPALTALIILSERLAEISGSKRSCC